MKTSRKLLLLGAALAVVAVACGGGSSDTLEAEPASLPVNDGGNVAAGACLAGAEDCQDMGVQPDLEPPLLAGEPVADVADSDVVTPLVGGGLSVADVTSTDIDGGFAIEGFLVDTGDNAFLCELLAESFPPQCGGERIPFDNSAGIEFDIETANGVTWSNDLIVVVGEVIDGTFVATPTS